MRIYNATYQNVIIDWANATLPIREGSPISADGKVSNDSDAIGLCPRYIWQEPLENKTVPILIGGDVVLPEVEAKYGSELTEDALASMGGINFYNDDGSIDKESGGGGGGGILVANAVFNDVEDRIELDKTYNEIVTSINSKIPAYIFYSFYDEEEENYIHQLVPVSVCMDIAESDYKVYVIGFAGGNSETFFYSATPDGVLVLGD